MATSDVPGGAEQEVPFPTWAKALGSLLIAGHLVAVCTSVLSAFSGPWPVGSGGSEMATAPHFAQLMGRAMIPYLEKIKLTHNYHFLSNRPRVASRFEAILRDVDGKEIVRVALPDPKAGSAAQHRQRLLAQGLAEEEPVLPLPGELVAAKGQQIRSVQFWEATQAGPNRLTTVKEHLIPRDREVFGPTPWSQLLARSYARRLGRTHDAATVEIVRTTKDYIPPDVLFSDSPPPLAAFDPVVASFGVVDVNRSNN